MRTYLLLAILAQSIGCGGGSKGTGDGSPTDTTAAANFSFFITSSGGPNGGDYLPLPTIVHGDRGLKPRTT